MDVQIKYRKMERYTICTCSSRDFLDKKKIAGIAASLKSKGHEVKLVSDLCGLCRDRDSSLKEIAGTTVIACHQRAVKALFDRCGLVPEKIIDIREEGNPVPIEEDLSPEILQKVSAEISSFPSDNGKDPWFPAIDYSECIGCRKCFDFCLFGVYTIEEGKVTVTNPDNCKNGCPACARTCPKGAVIFPKHPFAPINGGKDSSPKESESPFVGIDPDAMYAQAIKERLEHRRQTGMALRNPSQKK